VRQQASKRSRGQTPDRIRCQGAKQRPALGDPAQSLFEDRNREDSSHQVADDQGNQCSVGGEVGAQQDAGRLGAEPPLQARPQQLGRQMKDGESAAGHRDCGRGRHQALLVGGHRQVADLPSRRHPRPWNVRHQALLQPAGCRRGQQGRARGLAADVDEQRRQVDVGARAG
jgi:hypothetical protein